MIVVEGGDNVGKTTLVNLLLELDPSLHQLKRKRFRPDRDETIGSSYIDCLLPQDGDRLVHSQGVADRLLASECIYGPLFRGKSRISVREHFVIRSLLKSYATVIVHCDVSDETVMEQWRERDQMYDDPLAIVRAYRQQMGEIFKGFPMITFDWTKDGPDVVEEILNLHYQLKNRELLSWWGSLPFGSGVLDQPATIIVGELSFGGINRSLVPMNNEEGDFFIPCWLAAGGNNNVYITSAVKGTHYDISILREELNRLGRGFTRIIGLGDDAKRMIQSLDLNFSPEITYLPHPLYWSKFKADPLQSYTQMLKEVLK